MSERGRIRAGLGIPSMVLVLVVLCLSMLGVLSLISARSDDALARRYASLTAAYDEAAAAAQRALAGLDIRMTEAWRASGDDAAYQAACELITSAGDAQVEWSGNSAVMRFDAGFDRELVVEIQRCAWEEAQKKRFTLVRHTLEDTLEWEQTDSLFLMGL